MGIIVLNALKSSGNMEEAISFYEAAIQEDRLNFRSSKEIKTLEGKYNNLGLVFLYLGKYSQAEKYFEKSLEIRQKKQDKDHPKTATTLNNIASVYDRQGKYEEAIKYFFRALEIREKKLGKDHPETAITLNNIAGVYDSQGKYEEAIKYYFRALEIREKN